MNRLSVCLVTLFFVIIKSCACQNNLDKISSIVQYIENIIKEHRLLKHDFLQCFSNGSYNNMNDALKVFATNHYSYSKNFKDYLENVANRLNDEAKEAIKQNMDEEEGIYHEDDLVNMETKGFDRDSFNNIPHRILINTFLNKLNVDASEFKNVDSPGYKFTQYMFNKYATTTPCESLAIIAFGIEDTVSTLYTYIIKGLEKTDIPKNDYVFFPLHTYIDDGHANVLKKQFEKYVEMDIINNTNECTNAGNHIKEVLDARVNMYDSIRKTLIDNKNDVCLLPQTISQECEIKKATLLTQNMFQNDWNIKQKIALSSRILADAGHGNLLSGQVTCRDPHNKDNVYMFTNTYGYPLEITKASNILRVDENLNVVDDELNIINENSSDYRMPNRATRFHMYVYKRNPEINCIIHSHPVYTSALSMMGEELVINHMDVMGLYNRTAYISEWPGVPFGDTADKEGQWIINSVNEGKPALLLAHHGLTVAGKNIEEVTHMSYFFELAAKLQILSKSNGKVLPNVNVTEAIIARDWRMQDGPVKAYFKSWVDQAFKNNHQDALE